MTQMSEAYKRAMAKSYANQKTTFAINHDRLGKVVEIPLGFQPLGIASRRLSDNQDEIAIAAYFEPAICLARIARGHIGLQFEVEWIRGIHYEDGATIRLFPDLAAGGANRAQTVNFGWNGCLLVSRNCESRFFIIFPSLHGTPEKWGSWNHGSFALPVSDGNIIHSALLVNPDAEQPTIITVESGTDLESWSLGRYERIMNRWQRLEGRRSLPPYVYGIGQNPRDFREESWLVTDYRFEGPPGVMRGTTLVLPGVYGNGICFLSDGSALVTRYGHGHPCAFNGVPGALIYIPSELLKP